MGTAVAVIAGISTFLPFINNLVVGIEGLFSHHTKAGTTKKQIAMSTIISTLTAIGLVVPSTGQLDPALESIASSLIDNIVAWKNKVGEFQPTTPTA